MLSTEENDLLTRVEQGTPMGDLIRQYWIPAVRSEELPEPDCEMDKVTAILQDTTVPSQRDAVRRLHPPLRRGADRGWVPQQLRHARRRKRLGLGFQFPRRARRRDHHQ